MKTAAASAILVSALINSVAAYSHESARLPALYARSESDYDFFPSHLYRRSPVVDKKKGVAETSGGRATLDRSTGEIKAHHKASTLPTTNQNVVNFAESEKQNPKGTPGTQDQKKKARAHDNSKNAQFHKDPSKKGKTLDAEIPVAFHPVPGQHRKFGEVDASEDGRQGGFISSVSALARGTNAKTVEFTPDPNGPQPRRGSPDAPAKHTRSKDKNPGQKREAEAAFWDGYEYALELVGREALAEPIAYAEDDMLYEREAEPEAWFEDDFDYYYY